MPISLPRDLRLWLSRDVMPFWSQRAISAKTGLSYESLNPDGTPLASADLRVRVQFRQIYSFAHAAALGWFPEGRDVALNLWDRVLQTCRPTDGGRGFVHILAPDLTILDATRDSYDHAFAILALSWLARATGDAQVLAEIEAILAFVDEDMADASGLLSEGLPARLPLRQNPQMHWFEAMLALHEATGHREGKGRADRHLAQFKRLMLDADRHLVGEYFNADWSIADGEKGQHVEPGHLAEWVWLIRSHERLFGLARQEWPSLMLDRAEGFRDPASGLLPDLVNRQGSVLIPTSRIWLQTELCKAWIAEAEAGRPEARGRALEALAKLDRLYLKAPFAQGWVDQFSADGKPLTGPVPASILYHVFVAIAEADRVLTSPSA